MAYPRQAVCDGLIGQMDLENKPDARVAIITDRDELDKQIQRV